MSSAKPPEFFFDRSLGKNSAQKLIEAGHVLHLIADFYPDDAKDVPDEDWIAEGCERGWVLLTKDRKIRYRADELAALNGHLFCLADGNVNLDVIAKRFEAAMHSIQRAVAKHDRGFWHVHADGKIKKMWP